MNFLTMEYFLSIAEHRNITKAAAELHITQQTLSAHLTALEKELDTKLFIRSSPMELTHVGTVFLKHAAIIFENYQSMWNEFNDLTNNQRGKLMIGIDFTRSRTLMPQVISAFNAEYPNIEVRLTEGTNREIIRALSNREIDIGIGRFGEAVQGLELLPYYREEVLLLVPPQVKNCGPLRKIHFLKDLSDFKNFPFVLGSESNKVGQIARTLLSEVPYTPIIKAQSNNIDTLLELCARGVGVCFAPKSAVKSILTEEQLAAMTVYQVGEDSSYPIKFAYRKTSYQWKIIDEFIRIAVDDLKRTLPLNYTY